MRRLCVLWTALLGIGLGGPFLSASISMAAEMTACDTPAASSCQCGAVPCVDSCDACYGSVAIGLGCCTGPNCVERAAAVGAFNCTCRGSYKFPVPPQYTYHWPGMYAQQTMTACVSPWQYELLVLDPLAPAARVPSGTSPVSLPPAPSPQR